MNESQRAKLFADLLQEVILQEDLHNEVIDDIYQSPSTGPRTKTAPPCGCVSKCGDVSNHDENTILEGIVLDADDRTFESSVLQDNIQFARRAGFSNL